MPNADLISTFSLEKVGDYRIGCTDCTTDVYAGCMTAPCRQRKDAGEGSTVICECPLFRGPFQYGRAGQQYTCDAGDGLVWSAAYNPDGCGDPLSGKSPSGD